MSKRPWSALVLGLALAPGLVAHADVLRVEQVSAPRTSAEITVPVVLENLGSVGGFELRISYDPARLTALAPEPGARAENFETFGANLTSPGLVVVVAIADFLGGGTVPPLDPGQGNIVNLRFTPVDGVGAGRVPLLLVQGSVSNPSGTQLVVPALQDGWIQLTGGVPTQTASWGGVKCAFGGAALPPR